MEELPGKSNYFIGNDSKKWRTDIPTYAKVKYQDVYPGVDLVYYGNQRQLEYDFVVAPGGDPKAIKIAFGGVGARPAVPLRIDANGDLVLETAGEEIRLHKPLVYQEVDGVKQAIQGSFVLLELGTQDSERRTRRVGFQVAEYNTSKPLVIDPVLSYSTYLGGSGDDRFPIIAVDATGHVYLVGQTSSTNFLTVNPLQPTYGGGPFDVFVAKRYHADGKFSVRSRILKPRINAD